MMQIKLCPSGAVDWKFVELGYPSLALGLLTEGGERHFSPLGMGEEVPQVSQSFCLVFFCWGFFFRRQGIRCFHASDVVFFVLPLLK